MRRNEFEHIREDVRTAMLEAERHDPPFVPEALFRLIDKVGEVAMLGDREHTSPFHYCAICYPREWATALLRDVQLRAVSKVPYGEPHHDEPPEDHRD